MEKPILFNTEIVKAILEGRKTSTRRIMKPQPTSALTSLKTLNKQPYDVGDILWVRETWYTPCNKKECSKYENCQEGCSALDDYYYKADKLPLGCQEPKWRPSIHMPKAAARIFLKVTDVKVERLQEITEEQIKKEGVKEEFPPLAKDEFRNLWDSTLNKEKIDMYGWDANPWVWVIKFERRKL